MSPANRNVLVGLTVLGGLIGFVGMLLKFSGGATQFFRGGDQVQVEFHCDRADGLAEGSAVTYRGVTVGRITGIRRGNDSRDILISALIDNTPPLPGNVIGHIRTVSMISGIASIAMDTIGGPSADAKGTLTEGEKIDAIYVGSELLPPEFSQDLKGVGDYINDPKIAADLRASLENIRHISEKISKFSDRLDSLGDQATGTITDARETVKDARADVDKLSHQVDGRMLEISRALETFNSIISKVNTGQGSAGQLVNDPRLYQSLVDNSRELNATILDLKRLIEQWEQEGVTLKLK
jgi:phospholipid/cholesterol/gamma-HCH transport system substrate-binding protein